MKNNSYPTWLVPIEIAKELKDIGFDIPCVFVLTNKDKIGFTTKGNNQYHLFKELDLNSNSEGSLVCIPTYEQLFEWFREKGYDSFIDIDNQSMYDEGCYYCYVITNERGRTIDSKSDFDDYNEAREALVKSLIQTYKNKQL